MKEHSTSIIRILICDDDPGDCKLIRTVLQNISRSQFINKDFIVYEAHTEEEISAALKDFEIDLIFLDLLMPDKSGMEWLFEIVQMNIAPVIIVTGHSDSEIRFEASQAGSHSFIPKAWFTSPSSAVALVNRAINKTLDIWEMEKSIEKTKAKHIK